MSLFVYLEGPLRVSPDRKWVVGDNGAVPVGSLNAVGIYPLENTADMCKLTFYHRSSGHYVPTSKAVCPCADAHALLAQLTNPFLVSGKK